MEEMEERKHTWREAHGDADYIPCGNAYCVEGNCPDCEIQMRLQVERKAEQGIDFEGLTGPERQFVESNR